MKPGITLAMIVKNDAKRLRRCLDSVRGSVDDMVVVDTGSTDDTIQVAKQAGARVYGIEWPGAFDKALNEALDKVDTEWTLRLDSDEWFEEDPSEIIQAAVRQDEAFAYYLVRQDLLDDRPPMEIQLLRLWRTHPNIRYEGIVHEVIPLDTLKAAAGERKIVEMPLVLMHDGYAAGSLPAKRRRNIELLKRELERRPGEVHYELALAEALVAEGDPEGAAMANRIADAAIAQPDTRHDAPMMPWALGIALETTPEDDLFKPRIQAIIRHILRWHFDNATAMWGVATTEMKRNNLFHAYQALLQLEEMGQTGEYDRLAPVPSAFIREGAWTYLGNVAFALSKTEVARRNYQRLLELDPRHPVATARLRELPEPLPLAPEEEGVGDGGKSQ